MENAYISMCWTILPEVEAVPTFEFIRHFFCFY